MGRISSWLKFGGAGVLGFVATLPLVGGSCGRTACIVVAPGESACPTSHQALTRFTVQGCTGPVMSVDGAGERDGDLCCYPVTQTDDNFDCSGSLGGFGGFAGGSSGDCGSAGDPCSVDSDCCGDFCNSDDICNDEPCGAAGDPCDPSATSGDLSCCPGSTCDPFMNQCL